MIWRLTYCNKKGLEARIDIIRGNRTPIEVVQGSGQPFTLSYKLDKNDKSGHIMTSSADIEIFETETFNIDDLKTSNETELKVEYFEDNVLTWSGFILPDFFSREIGSPNIVRMTASDRLTALKGITLSDLPAKVSLRNLIELSLEQTGLTLSLASQIQINQGSTNILDSEILSQRLTDVRGRSISCYDILMSIMVGTNSTIRQRAGQWEVYNKLEHELRTPTISFDKVERGAIRTIQPVASSVGVYNEFGGNRLHPNNYDFSLGLANWTSRNGFEAYIDNKVVSSFLGGTPIYQPDVTTNDYLVNFNNWVTNETNLDTAPFLESNNIPIASTQSNTVEVEVDISAVMAEKLSSSTAISFLRYAIIATNGVDTYALTTNGLFEAYDPENINEHSIILAGGQQPPLLLASPAYTNSSKRKGVLEVSNVNDFHVNIRIYGSSFEQYVNVNFASVRFGNKTETPKGNLYKTTQGSNYTKLHDVETVIFGDYIRKGLNGYFYDYPIDETSNLYLPNGELSDPTWITAFDTTERPLLHHISRQKSRLFSVAHDILKANINVESFDPLAVFQDCKGGKYVVVSARFDFLRSEVDVELEQIVSDSAILKRDYIYSYFGEGEDTIKSIGGISGGGGGAGGGDGMTSEQLEMLTNLADWWRLDAENDAIYSLKSVYSLKGVSALGLGSEGGGGGGDISMLDSWANYTPAKSNYYVPASLLVPFRSDTLSRLESLEAGGDPIDIEIGGRNLLLNSIKGTTTNNWSFVEADKGLKDEEEVTVQMWCEGSGTIVCFRDNGYTGGGTLYATNGYGKVTYKVKPYTTNPANDGRVLLLISGTNVKVKLEKGNKATDWTPAPEDQVSDWSTTDVASFSFIKNKPTQLSQFADNIGVGTHIANNTIHITSVERTNWNDANSKKHTHGNKALLDLITQSNIDVLAKLSIVDGNIKVDTTLWATGGISALGLGSGGGSGGGVDMLDSWANYTSAKANYYVPASLLVPFRNDTLSRLTSLESGSATSIVTTGSGNAITSLTKSGSVITANKGLTFALSTHTHTIAQITGLQGVLEYTERELLESQGYMKARYIRDWIKGSSANNANYWNELKVFNKAGVNIAIGKIPTSNGVLGTPANLTDNILDNHTYTEPTPTTPTSQYVQIDLGQVHNDIDYIHVWHYYHDGRTFNGTKTQISEDGITWKTIFDSDVSGTYVETEGGKVHNHKGLDDKLNLTGGTLSGTLTTADIHIAHNKRIGISYSDTNSTLYNYFYGGSVLNLRVGEWTGGTINVFNIETNGGNKALSITNITGNVGIGTTNPLYKLDVAGTGRVTGNMTIGGNLIITPTPALSDGIQYGSYKVLRINQANNGTVLSTPLAGTITLRPNGDASTTGQLTINSAGLVTLSGALTGATTGSFSVSVSTPKVDFGNGFTIEPSGTELVFKYNGVIKQRMLSTGTILATGGITALST